MVWDPFAPFQAIGVSEHAEFTKQIDAYRIQYPQAEDVYHDLGWMLARNPTEGTQIGSTEYYVLETEEGGNTPSFWIAYEYTSGASEVLLLAIKAVHIGRED
jgi:hypothetical protein